MQIKKQAGVENTRLFFLFGVCVNYCFCGGLS